MTTTILVDLLRSLANDFDDHTYPVAVYEALLERVQVAQRPQELGDALTVALSWKDGKVRLATAHSGQPIEAPGIDYAVSTAKPNTVGDRHLEILCSQEFFDWARDVRGSHEFEIARIDDLQIKFGLWKSIVIPVFVLHCLQPRVFPIVDQHVLRAMTFLTSGSVEFDVSPGKYSVYRAWWCRLVAEAGLTPADATPCELKALDCGLWVLGKHLKRRWGGSGSPCRNGRAPNPPASSAAPSEVPGRQLGTDSPEFKQRAVELARTMTQKDAIQQAAADFRIQLKPSYLRYPGSHFDRWRKQGFGMS